jgi:hypothetical protein
MNEAIKAIDGWMFEQELVRLYEIAERVPADGLAVEIGAWKGRSSAAIYSGAAGLKRVVSVDTWQGSPGEMEPEVANEEDVLGIYKSNMATLGIQVSELPSWEHMDNGNYYVVGDSLAVVDAVPDASIAWLFYDGYHGTTGENIDRWLPKMQPDGLLTGHDYFGFFESIQQEIHKRFYINEIHCSIWIKFLGIERPGWYG